MRVTLYGEARIFKIYDLSRLEAEGLDISSYDLESKEDIKELFESVNELVESGEADAYGDYTEIEGLDPENCSIKADSARIVLDEAVLKPVEPARLLEDIGEGRLFLVRIMEGEALWDLENELEPKRIDPQKLQIGYADCLESDNYELLQNSLEALLCDTVLADRISYEDHDLERVDFVFRPLRIDSWLYLKRETQTGTILERINYGGRRLADADLDLEEMEED